MLNPAMWGLIQQLPPYNKPFPPGEKERWMSAFQALLELDYPNEPLPPAPPPPVSNEFVEEGCEQFSSSPIRGQQ